MSDAASRFLVGFIRYAHQSLLEVAQDLSDEQLAWRAARRAPPIRFHLWHIARWADHLQAALPTMTPQLAGRLGAGQELWDAEAIASQWGIVPAVLTTEVLGGNVQAGVGLDDDASAALPLPTKKRLLDYARRAFAAADQAVAAVDDTDLPARCTDLYGERGSVGKVLTIHLTHANRHPGMIEALRGVQDLRGTASW